MGMLNLHWWRISLIVVDNELNGLGARPSLSELQISLQWNIAYVEASQIIQRFIAEHLMLYVIVDFILDLYYYGIGMHLNSRP